MKCLIFGSSCHFGQYETTTADGLALDNDMSRISEITHARLITANVHYRLFGKLIEDLPHLEDFEAPVMQGSSPAKVVKTLASSSPTKGFIGRSFGFLKCAGCPSSMKESPPLIEIEWPSQPLVDGVICLFPPLVVGSTSNGNGEQV